MVSRVQNRLFDPRRGFERGASLPKFGLWMLARWFFFATAFPWPSPLKVWLLRLFGARVGNRVYLKPRISIHFPWKLAVGDDTWIGEEVTIINFEPIDIGSNCCISQRAFICSGNHNFRDESMSYRNAAIVIEDGVWLGACTFCGPGVKIGEDCVVTAGSVVVSSSEPNLILQGNPAVMSGYRWKAT